MVEPLKRRPAAPSSPPSRSALPPKPSAPEGRAASSGSRPVARAPLPPKAAPAGRSSASSGSRPAVRASIPTKAPAADAGKRKILIFSAAGGGVLLLVVLAAVMMSGGEKPRKVEREDAAPPAPLKPVAVAPKPVTPSPAATANADDDFKKAIQDSRKVMGDISKKSADREKKEKEDKEKEDKAKEAEREAEKKAADVKDKEAFAAYDRRRRDRREESAKQLEEAKKAVEEDRRSEIARQKALVEKMKNLKLTIKTKGGLTLQNVTVQGMTRDELRLAFTYEGAQAEQAFPIDFVEDRSYVDLLKAVYKGDGASGSYELGRHLVLRKLWKDAQSAFEDCVKQDSAYQPRVPDLSRILHNEAAFKGSARKIGSDQLFITYDFSDAAQAQDFTPVQPPGQITVEGGELKLVSPMMASWSLKGVDFERDVEVDATVIFESDKTALLFGSFHNFERKGYYAVVNSQNPPGHVLHRLDGPAKSSVLISQAAPKIVAGAETRLRYQVKAGVFKVFIGEQEVINQADATYAKGWCLLGVAAGSVRVKKLTIQGHVNPLEIDKRFAEVEVLVRRALEADLGKKKKKEDEDVDPLSAEDEYLLDRLSGAVRGEFTRQRASLVKAIQKRQIRPEHLKSFDSVVQSAPDFAAGRYWKGVALLQGRKTDEAKAEIAEAIRLFPDFHEAQLTLAQVELDERDFAAAADRVKKALELSPGYGDAIALGAYLKFINAVAAKGHAKSLANDAKESVSDLELARKLDPDSESVATTQKNVLNVVKGPQHLGAKYEKEFPHYIVMTDMSVDKTVLYGTRLEAAYKFYSETFKDVFTEEKRPKPRVAIFNTREAYLTYGELTLSNRQEWTLGYFHPFYRELLLFEDVDQEATLQTLYHEAFHQFMALMVPKAPFWYNEGIAEFMGGIKVEVNKTQSKIVERARILDGRLKGLKMSLNFALKFEDIMMQTPAQFYSGPVSFKYAQAWSMVHFLYEASGGKHRSKIEAYFKKLKDGGSPRDAFDTAFGDGKVDDLQKEWLEYVKKMEPLKK
jgi:tetratricopeptide (TPR) repeat protein